MIEVNCAAQQLSENIKVAFAEMSSQYLKHYASKVSRTLRFSVANLTWNVIEDIRFVHYVHLTKNSSLMLMMLKGIKINIRTEIKNYERRYHS